MPKGRNSAPGPVTRAIADIINVRMAELRTNKSRVSEHSGIARTTLGHMIDGDAVYDVEQLDQVCQALGVEIEDVLKEASERTASRVLDSGIQPITR